MILREIRIDALSELCYTLQLYLESPEVTNGEPQAKDEDATAVKFVVRKILEDAQQRLVFRAQAYIRQEIEGFRPRDEELMILARGRGLPQPIALSTSLDVAPVLGNASGASDVAVLDVESPDDVEPPVLDERPNAVTIGTLVYGGGEWYPTLQRTLYILGKLHRRVPHTVFEDLAQEAVDFGRKSLLGASDTIASKQTKIDGQFFLIKNLLMLREQLVPFQDANFVRKEDVLDFAALRDTVMKLLQSRWGIGALSNIGKGIISATAPRIVETYADAKEDLILETAKSCVEPVSSFMLKVAAFRLKNENRATKPLSEQSFGSSVQVIQVLENFKETLQKRLLYALSKMADYLGDKKTEDVLSNITDTYHTFFDTVTAEYDLSVSARLLPLEEVSRMIDTARKRAMRVAVAGAVVATPPPLPRP
ncbi:hypothetical protein BDK51DRAFT_33551, partial [Blyttiomyces helicus]